MPDPALQTVELCGSQLLCNDLDERIQMQAKANPTAGQFANGDYKLVLGEAIAKALARHHAMSEQTLQNPKVFDDVAEALLADVYEQARTLSSKRPEPYISP
jgi:hypothetical protein